MKNRLVLSPLCLLLAALPLARLQAGSVTAIREGTQIIFRDGPREICRYQAEPGALPRPEIKDIYERGGYLTGLRSPSGVLLTDDFPANHLHHHAVWMAWTKTEFAGRQPDFWNMGQGKGRVEFVSVEKTWEKDGSAGLTARHRHVDLQTQPATVALNETWNIQVSSAETPVPHFVLDLTSTQTCAGSEPLVLPQYHYGGLGFRGHGAWDGAKNLQLLTPAGETGRVKINTSRAHWCWLGGEVEGKTAGVLIMGHPANFRSPQPIRAHPEEPFFCFAPQQLGEMALKPGEEYVSRYRFILADGKITPEQAQHWWEDYAAPPK